MHRICEKPLLLLFAQFRSQFGSRDKQTGGLVEVNLDFSTFPPVIRYSQQQIEVLVGILTMRLDVSILVLNDPASLLLRL